MTHARLTTLAALVSLFPAASAFAQDDTRAGLFADARQLPLISQSIDVTAAAGEAELHIVQVFANDGKAEAQADYYLHLPEGAAVDGFGFWTGDTFHASKLAEKSEAEAAHRAAASSGRTTALLKREGNMHHFSVYPVGAGETMQVETRLRIPVAMDLGRAHLRLPVRRFLGRAPIASTARIRVETDHPIAEYGLNDVSSVELSRSPTEVDLALSTARGIEMWWQEEGPPLSMTAQAVVIEGQAFGVELRTVFNRAGPMRPVSRYELLIDGSFSMRRRRSAVEAAVTRVYERADAPVTAHVIAETSQMIKGDADAVMQAFDAIGGHHTSWDALELAAQEARCEVAEVRCLLITDPQTDGLEKIGASELTTLFLSDAHELAHTELARPKAGLIYRPDAEPQSKLHNLVDELVRPVLSIVSVTQGPMSLELPPRQKRSVAEGGMLRLFARTTSLEPITLIASIEGDELMRTLQPTQLDAHGDDGRRVRRGYYQRALDEMLAKYREAGSSELKRKIIATSIREGVPTELTSLQVDAPKTSLYAIKPGDPLLTVHNEPGVIDVEAHYPFGESRRMVFDASSDTFKDRFLVPRGWRDQVYRIEIFKRFENGRTKKEHAYYAIDSRGPTATLLYDHESSRLTVDTGAATVDVSRVVVQTKTETFELSPLDGRWSIDRAKLPDVFNVVVRDRAGNRTIFSVEFAKGRLEVHQPSRTRGRGGREYQARPSMPMFLRPLHLASDLRVTGRNIQLAFEGRTLEFPYDGTVVRSLASRAQLRVDENTVVFGTDAGDLVTLRCEATRCRAEPIATQSAKTRFDGHAVTGLAKHRGRVLVGVLGRGLFELDGTRLTKSGLRVGSRFVTAIETRRERTLIATMYNGLWRVAGRRAIKTRFPHDHVYDLRHDKEGLLVLSGQGHYRRIGTDRFVALNRPTGLDTQTPSLTSAVVHRGRTFIGGFDGGLFELTEGMPMRLPLRGGAERVHINQLASFDGHLFVASEDGVDRLTVSEGRFEVDRILDGSAYDFDVSDDRLAIATGKGLYVLEAGKGPRRVDFQKGVGEPRLGSVAWHEGVLYAGGLDGLFRFDADGATQLGVGAGYTAGWVTALYSAGEEMLVGTYDEGVFSLRDAKVSRVPGLERQWVPMQAIQGVGSDIWVGGLGMNPARIDASGLAHSVPVPARDTNGFIGSDERVQLLTTDGLAELELSPDELARR